MALIDVRCLTCGATNEAFRAAADWPNTPPCPACGAATEQMHLPRAAYSNPDPIVVFQANDGSYRYPGDRSGASVANYRKLGYKEIELRNFAEVRRFEQSVNQQEDSKRAMTVEGREQQRQLREAVSRGELRRQMGQMSHLGRDLARAAMTRNDRKPRERATGSSGFHSEAYSYTRSNREESRGTDGRRRRD